MPKININGITREMTPDEIAEMERLAAEMPAPEPTPEDRLAALEAALKTALLERDAALVELAGMLAEERK